MRGIQKKDKVQPPFQSTLFTASDLQLLCWHTIKQLEEVNKIKGRVSVCCLNCKWRKKLTEFLCFVVLAVSPRDSYLPLLLDLAGCITLLRIQFPVVFCFIMGRSVLAQAHDTGDARFEPLSQHLLLSGLHWSVGRKTSEQYLEMEHDRFCPIYRTWSLTD
jgi:hypothetical protein